VFQASTERLMIVFRSSDMFFPLSLVVAVDFM